MSNIDWDPNDYMFSFEDVQPYEGLLEDMPIHHKVDKLRKFFAGEIIGEIRRCLNAQAELSALILCLAAIDYLSGFYIGRESTGKDYKDFLRCKYFSKDYAPYIDDIYVQLRNGLMHNLVVVNPWRGSGTRFIIYVNSPRHLHIDDNGRLIFSVTTFAEDIRRAFWMYVHDIIMKGDSYPKLVENFHKRFDKLHGQGAFMERNTE